MRACVALIFLVGVGSAFGQGLWKDPDQPVAARVNDLVSQLTLDEKIGQMMNSAPAIPRLGIPRYQWWSEALHGLLKPAPCTSFPQCIGLAATFDTALEFQIASAISDEARARFADERRRGVEEDDLGLDFWAPNINIFRDPRWGRGQETYGEDPFLTGQMAIQFVKGMQGNDQNYLKTIATPKHYAVHSGPDPIRYRFDAIVSPRDLWLTYLPAFQAAVMDGGAWSIMGAYSAVNGVPCCASTFLLDDVLRKRWGFRGYVVSDCDAIQNIWADHHYVATAEEAVAVAVRRGCDLDCGGSYGALKKAVAQGLISESEIDVALRRLFEARFRLGLFDPPARVPYTGIPMSVVASPAHAALALRAARESLVLLKNDGALPLSPRIKTIAVIGPNAQATETLLGNYNGSPSHVESIFGGIAAAAPSAKIIYAKGCDLTSLGSLEPIPLDCLTAPNGKPGLRGEYFANKDLSGQPKAVRVEAVDHDWGQGAPEVAGIGEDDFSVRWTGTLRPKLSGDYKIGQTNDDGMRVWLDDKLILDDWKDDSARTTTYDVHLDAGRAYRLKVEYYESKVYATAKLVWATPNAKPFADAVAAAKQADAVVMVLGISGAIENESHDRDAIDLPKVQRDLLAAVQAATRKPIVLVLVNGGPITLGADEMDCNGIVEAWYPGQAGGTAVADALFGKFSPAGRLPVTIVKSLKDLPPIEDYTMKNRTYRYPGPKPQFPFGFGLSYTTFHYSNLSAPTTLGLGRPLSLGVTVKNIGTMESDEVVQVYRHFVAPSRPMPEQQLVAFKRIHLAPGESREVSLTVSPELLSALGDDTYLHPEAGKIAFSVGGGQPGYAKTLGAVVAVR